VAQIASVVVFLHLDFGAEVHTHLRLVLPPPMVALMVALGRWDCPTFLVTRVTPPFSPSAGRTPTAYPSISIHSPFPISLPFSLVRESLICAYLVVDESGVLRID
jgi:hypothetical protein